MKRTAGLILFCLLTHAATALSELICSHQPIVALVGDDVILPCHLEPPISAGSETVEWTKPGLDPKYIHVHQDGRLLYQLQNPSYNYRTRLFVDELTNGNVSMKIFSVKISDAGKYFCFLPSIHEAASIQLTVVNELLRCPESRVEAADGEDVTLEFHLDPERDVTLELFKLMFNQSKRVLVYRGDGENSSDDAEQFKGRVSLESNSENLSKGEFVVKISSVTTADAGKYTCTTENHKISCSIDLIIEPEENRIPGNPTDNGGGDHNNTYVTGIGIGVDIGIVVVIVIIIIIGIAVVLWRRSTSQSVFSLRKITLHHNGERQENNQNVAPEKIGLNAPLTAPADSSV